MGSTFVVFDCDPTQMAPGCSLDVQQVLPLPEASEYFVNLREKKAEERQARDRERLWTGFWYVNVGMDSPEQSRVGEDDSLYTRHWHNCVQFGYLAAGGGPGTADR